MVETESHLLVTPPQNEGEPIIVTTIRQTKLDSVGEASIRMIGKRFQAMAEFSGGVALIASAKALSLIVLGILVPATAPAVLVALTQTVAEFTAVIGGGLLLSKGTRDSFEAIQRRGEFIAVNALRRKQNTQIPR